MAVFQDAARFFGIFGPFGHAEQPQQFLIGFGYVVGDQKFDEGFVKAPLMSPGSDG
jgi:hypothetical protein